MYSRVFDLDKLKDKGKRHKAFVCRKVFCSGLRQAQAYLVLNAFWLDCRYYQRWTCVTHKWVAVMQMTPKSKVHLSTAMTPEMAVFKVSQEAMASDEYIQGVRFLTNQDKIDVGGKIAERITLTPPNDPLFSRHTSRAHQGSLAVDVGRNERDTDLNFPVVRLCREADEEFLRKENNAVRDMVAKWSHAFDKLDLEERAVEGATIFIKEGRKAMRVPTWLISQIILFITINLTPRAQDGPRYAALSAPDAATKRPNSAATGYLPGMSRPMREAKEFVYFRTLGALRALYSRVAAGAMDYLPWIPVRTAFKAEVVKLEKKVRTIQVVSYVWQIVGLNVVEPVFKWLRTPVNFSGIGLRTRGGIVKRVHEYFISMLSRIHNIGYVEARDKLNGLRKSEMDKTAWEANTEHTTARLVQLHWQSMTKMPDGSSLMPDDFQRLMASFWADFINPLLPTKGETFYSRLGLTPSGHILTLDGNTWRHTYMVIMCYLFVKSKRHNMSFGVAGCDCGICEIIPQELLGEKVTKEELQEMLVFLTVGDDFYGIEHKLTDHLCWFFDSVCGQNTVADVKVDGEAEFLRARLVDGEHYRETERVLAKLLHGERDICVRKAATLSLAFEAGANWELYELLKRYDAIVTARLGDIDQHLVRRRIDMVWEEVTVRTGILYKGVNYFPSRQEVLDFHTLSLKDKNYIQKKFKYESFHRTLFEEVAQ